MLRRHCRRCRCSLPAPGAPQRTHAAAVCRILLSYAADSPGVMRILDWGYAQALLNVTTGTTLALDQIYSRRALRLVAEGRLLTSAAACHGCFWIWLRGAPP